MAKRQVVEVPGLKLHGAQPIPPAVKIGNMVFTGGIAGQDPQTNKVPDELERQVVLAFENMRRIVEAAGGSTDDIGRVDVYLKDMGTRELVNREWLKMFPDESNRPCRHTTRLDLPGNYAIQLQMIAVL